MLLGLVERLLGRLGRVCAAAGRKGADRADGVSRPGWVGLVRGVRRVRAQTGLEAC